MSLLNKLKETAVKSDSTSKKEKSPSYVLNLSFFKKHGFDNPEEMVKNANKDLEEISNLDAQIKILQAKMDTIKSRYTAIAKEAFIDKYEEDKVQPDNFKIMSDDGKSTAQFIVKDVYTSKEFDAIKDVSPELISEETVVKANLELITKYDKVLTKFFEKSKEIEDNDRDLFFTSEIVTSIKKGSIANLGIISEKKSKSKNKFYVKQLFELISPTHYISNFKTQK